ncbi:18490_t:CDS:1, partial [Gigaspora margarita]
YQNSRIEEMVYIFVDLIEKYSGIELATCGIKKHQKWRDIKGSKTTE